MRGSRQFGHSVVWGARKASCARRLSRRALECRRLGFGIITPFKSRHKEAQKAQDSFLIVLRFLCLLWLSQVLQSRPTRIDIIRNAIALARVPVSAAFRADAFTVFATKHASGYGQQNLLFHDLINVERFAVKH